MNAARAGAVQSPAARNGELAGRKVLLVEDQAEIRDITSRILSELGCDVRTVAGSNSALNYLKGGSELDMLVTDLVLPGDCDGEGRPWCICWGPAMWVVPGRWC